MGSADKFPDAKIESSYCNGHNEDYVVRASNEYSSCYENNYILIEGEYAMNQNENFLIVMIKFIGSAQGILFSIPLHLSMY